MNETHLKGQFESSDKNFEMEILSRLENIGKVEIATIRNKIPPRFQNNFEQLSEETKIAFALFNQMTKGEMEQLKNRCRDYMPALHDVKAKLTKYLLFTKNN